ncbi:MAG TPA: glutamate-5-semialdehyde dehydrogenase, partial [Opitutae bacterium]|nr:glutamate-5-semialdehyde dehydrogenase [Opitutae bacterium]
MSQDVSQIINDLALRAREASLALAKASSSDKDDALQAIARALESNRKLLLEENQKDLDSAGENGLSEAMVDRLRLTHERIDGMAQGLRQLIDLPDPVDSLIHETTRPNGLLIKKVSTPIGVIAIIYESRPNVTIDCAGLCLKSGNASILRGGKEAFHSNRALASVIEQGLEQSSLPKDSVQLVPTVEREALNHMLTLDELIHCIIPRGGEGLIRFVAENSRIPVIKHYKGVCNLYVDSEADLDLARKIAINAKCQRPGVCKAIENLFVHQDAAAEFLPEVAGSLWHEGVELRVDERSRTQLQSSTGT